MQRTVLLADNSIAVQKTLGLALAHDDVAIVSVEDGDTALQQASATRPDLVLASLAIPGTNGYELCESIKRECSRTAVLLLAGPKDGIDLERAKRAGCDGYLVKPFDARTLIEAVEAVLARAARLQDAAPIHGALPASPPPARSILGENDARDPGEDLPDGTDPDHKPKAVAEAAPAGPSSRQDGLGAKDPSNRAPPEVQLALETVAREAFKELSEGMLDEVLDKIERIAWEVIPEMTEIALRHERIERDRPRSPNDGETKKRP